MGLDLVTIMLTVVTQTLQLVQRTMVVHYYQLSNNYSSSDNCNINNNNNNISNIDITYKTGP